MCANGVMATEIKNKNWTGDNNQYFVESIDSSLTNCSFGWSCKALESKIWVFGDSWTSIYPQRWVYQAVDIGLLERVLVNGYAGQTTDNALISFKNLVKIGCPKYLVWCLGMNNWDEGSVNETWKSAIDEVLSICKDKGIIPILYKVPNVPVWGGHAARTNNYKNAYIESLGVRYIDAPSALGDDGSGNWYEGFEQSSTDHVHTSKLGAKALMMQIIADFPEIEMY